jgi:hypothetical protein
MGRGVTVWQGVTKGCGFREEWSVFERVEVGELEGMGNEKWTIAECAQHLR